MELSVAGQIFSGIMGKIATSVYPVGSLLPSCRNLSSELGVNKNTVNKAFSMLKESGLARSVPGRGMLVVKRPDANRRESVLEMSSAMDRLLYQSRVAGVSADEVSRVFGSALSKWYESVRVSMVLVECNSWDALSLAGHIQEELPVSVDPMLLDDFVQGAESVLRDHDLVVTTFYHLSEVNAALGDSNAGRVVALQDRPSVQSLLALSKIPIGTPVGVVAGHERTVRMLRDLVQSCGPRVTSLALLEDPDNVRKLLYSAGTVVVSARCRTDLLKFAPTIPVVNIEFEVDEQSMEFLRRKVSLVFDSKGISRL